MAKKKTATPKAADPVEENPLMEDPVATPPNPAEDAVRKCIDLIDPQGKGHVPSGDSGVYQEVLETLRSAVEV